MTTEEVHCWRIANLAYLAYPVCLVWSLSIHCQFYCLQMTSFCLADDSYMPCKRVFQSSWFSKPRRLNYTFIKHQKLSCFDAKLTFLSLLQTIFSDDIFIFHPLILIFILFCKLPVCIALILCQLRLNESCTYYDNVHLKILYTIWILFWLPIHADWFHPLLTGHMWLVYQICGRKQHSETHLVTLTDMIPTHIIKNAHYYTWGFYEEILHDYFGTLSDMINIARMWLSAAPSGKHNTYNMLINPAPR